MFNGGNKDKKVILFTFDGIALQHIFYSSIHLIQSALFFSEIIGQSALKKRLIQSVKDRRISHAQLFFGPEGAGALPLAIAYAQYISCTGDKDEDSCGKCPSCLKYAKLVHPDLHFLFPVNNTASKKEDPSCDDFLPEWRAFVLQNPYARLNDWYPVY